MNDLLPAAALKARYRVSDAALWRWGRDPALGFPKPVVISRRKYWRAIDLEAWEATLPNTTGLTPPRRKPAA